MQRYRFAASNRERGRFAYASYLLTTYLAPFVHDTWKMKRKGLELRISLLEEETDSFLRIVCSSGIFLPVHLAFCFSSLNKILERKTNGFATQLSSKNAFLSKRVSRDIIEIMNCCIFRGEKARREGGI